MPTESYAPVLPPPQVSMNLLGWLRVHLFSTWYNTLLTLGLAGGWCRRSHPRRLILGAMAILAPYELGRHGHLVFTGKSRVFSNQEVNRLIYSGR